jgi:hypothetical protein
VLEVVCAVETITGVEAVATAYHVTVTVEKALLVAADTVTVDVHPRRARIWSTPRALGF